MGPKERGPESHDAGTGVASVGSGRKRRPAAAVEPLVFVALVLLYIWVVKGTHRDLIRIPYLVVVVLIPIGSNLLHRDRPARLGFRLDNLGRSAAEVGLATAVGAIVVLIVAAAAGGFEGWPGMWRGFLTYPFWGLAQQYAMQSFAYRRLREALARPGLAAAATAVLFGSAHWPNVALAGVTVLGGYVWCRLFERHPNLITLALSHGWLAVLVRAVWPAVWLHNLRIGPEFWTWTP